MATTLKLPHDIDDFIAKVRTEAKHHAPQVDKAVKWLANAVRARTDFLEVSVLTRNGKLARTCWVTLSGKRYAFSYNYKIGKIDIRANSTRGKTLHSTESADGQSNVKKLAAGP